MRSPNTRNFVMTFWSSMRYAGLLTINTRCIRTLKKKALARLATIIQPHSWPNTDDCHIDEALAVRAETLHIEYYSIVEKNTSNSDRSVFPFSTKKRPKELLMRYAPCKIIVCISLKRRRQCISQRSVRCWSQRYWNTLLQCQIVRVYKQHSQSNVENPFLPTIAFSWIFITLPLFCASQYTDLYTSPQLSCKHHAQFYAANPLI